MKYRLTAIKKFTVEVEAENQEQATKFADEEVDAPYYYLDWEIEEINE